MFTFLDSLFDFLFELLASPILRRLIGVPRQIYVTIAMNDINVIRGEGGHCYLQLGSHRVPQSVGINIIVNLDHPSRRGQMEFVQLVKLNRRRSPGPNGADQVFTSDGEWVLDSRDPYGGLTFPMGANPAAPPPEASMQDSPRSCCVAYVDGNPPGAAIRPYEIVSANDDFRTFIMWRPEAFGGRYRFALGHVEWHWDGVATIVGQNGDCNCAMNPQGQIGQWSLSSPPDHHRSLKRVPNMRRRPSWQRTTAVITWRDAS